MNRDDRAALIDMGRQFCPQLFADLQDEPAELDDGAVLALMGNALSVLHAAAESEAAAESAQAELAQVKADLEALLAQPASVVSDRDPEPEGEGQPSQAELARWLERQGLTVTRQQVHLQEQPGGRRRRVYRAVAHPATVDDVLGFKLDALSGEMHLVMSDGKTHCLPWR